MKERIIEALKDLGIKEVILDDESGNLTVEFASDDERVVMSNRDFAEGGL